jgi:hypothetical protein
MSQLTTDSAGHVNYGSGPGGNTYPTPTLGAFASTWGASDVEVNGNDTAGVVTFTASDTPAAGDVVTVAFASPYPTAPRAVMVQGAATDASAGPLFFATGVTGEGFTISAAAGAAKSYAVSYFVIPA